jgi:two-component system KDP operon response regulator KdpE
VSDHEPPNPAGAGEVKARILVIDDEPQIRRFLSIALRSQGYEVLEAETAAEGIARTATATPDLVVLDLGLPDADGKSVLAEIRGWSRVPVLVLSVRSAETEKVLALDGGANDYVTKPFGIQELLARVRGLLRDRGAVAAGEGQAIFDDGRLRIDLGRRQVWLGGQPVHLTRKELGLLTALLANAGRVVTQTQLLRELWGPSHTHDSHYLRVFMGKLRQKIGDDPAEPRYLETVPGVGYRFLGGAGG